MRHEVVITPQRLILDCWLPTMWHMNIAPAKNTLLCVHELNLIRPMSRVKWNWWKDKQAATTRKQMVIVIERRDSEAMNCKQWRLKRIALRPARLTYAILSVMNSRENEYRSEVDMRSAESNRTREYAISTLYENDQSNQKIKSYQYSQHQTRHEGLQLILENRRNCVQTKQSRALDTLAREIACLFEHFTWTPLEYEYMPTTTTVEWRREKSEKKRQF